MNLPTGENAYSIQETLSKSRHFCVYKARNYSRGILVTIKTTEQRWRADFSIVNQLRREAETGLRLHHPHIRKTLALFEEDSILYMVCEYLAGDPLDALLGQPKADLGYDNSLRWILQLLDAVQYAHQQSVSHLNINPSNVLISAEHELKLFGFGKSPDAWKAADPDGSGIHPLLFTAPELFLGEPADFRADLYSIGVLAYLLICGQLPWTLDRKGIPSQQKEQTFQRPALNPDLLGKHVPHWLFNILNKALMLDPDKRFASAAEMSEAISSEREIPYESCLTRSSQPKPAPQIIPERVPPRFEPASPPPPAPDFKEPEPEELTPTLEVGHGAAEPETMDADFVVLRQEPEPPIPEPSRPAPTPIPEPAKPAPTLIPEPSRPASTPIPEPFKPVPTPIPEPARPTPPPGISIPISSQASRPDITRMQRLFKIFGLISLVIIAYIIVKYVIIRDKPNFAKAPAEEAVAANDAEFKVSNLPLELIYVPGDTTVIGHIAAEAEDDEFPPREVVVPDFSISACEITKEQWAMVYPEYVVAEEERDLPVTGISFNAALEYCNEKSRLDGLDPCYDFMSNGVYCDFTATGYRLPTEAEWEYAAKARQRDVFPDYSGSDSPDAVAWYSANSEGGPRPVGLKSANALGIFDMSGNVSEWVWNWYGRYSNNAVALFAGPDTGTDKVIRGGSWKDEASGLRITNRNAVKPYLQTDYIGFRVVRSR